MPYCPVHLNLLGLEAFLRPPHFFAKLLGQSCRKGGSSSSGEEQYRLVNAQIGIARESTIRTIKKNRSSSAENQSVSKFTCLTSWQRSLLTFERRGNGVEERALSGRTVVEESASYVQELERWGEGRERSRWCRGGTQMEPL